MHKFSHKFAGFAFGLMLFCGLAAAEPVALNPAHPDRYVVVRGDTLWDIAARFLRDHVTVWMGRVESNRFGGGQATEQHQAECKPGELVTELMHSDPFATGWLEFGQIRIIIW